MSDKPWGGVFDSLTDRRVELFTESVSFDQRLAPHDIQGSIAHAQMLCKIGFLKPSERDEIVTGLSDIEAQIAACLYEGKARESRHNATIFANPGCLLANTHLSEVI